MIIFNGTEDDCFENVLLVKLIFIYLLSNCFRLKTLKATTKAPAVDLLRLGILTAF